MVRASMPKSHQSTPQKSQQLRHRILAKPGFNNPRHRKIFGTHASEMPLATDERGAMMTSISQTQSRYTLTLSCLAII